MDNKIIVSFSTIPTRINDIEPVLKSLNNQTLKPDKIYLNIPKKYKRFSEQLIKLHSDLKTKIEDYAATLAAAAPNDDKADPFI